MSRLNSLVTKYKYFYSANASTCPICGRALLDVAYDASKSEEIGQKDSDLVWYCSSNDQILANNKICFRCGQPVFVKDAEIDNTHIFYIYIDGFFGWTGSVHTLTIAIDTTSQTIKCTTFEGLHHLDIVIDDALCEYLLKNKDKLISYHSRRKEKKWMDATTYYFSFYDGEKSSDFCFGSKYVKSHKLFIPLVEFTEKVKKKILSNKKSSKV